MTDSNKTHIQIKSGKATGLTSTAHGANFNAVAFNIDFIVSKNPTLALAILKLYEEASRVKEDDPSHPEEDYSLALDAIKDLLK